MNRIVTDVCDNYGENVWVSFKMICLMLSPNVITTSHGDILLQVCIAGYLWGFLLKSIQHKKEGISPSVNEIPFSNRLYETTFS